jgi:hypothetical protein
MYLSTADNATALHIIYTVTTMDEGTEKFGTLQRNMDPASACVLAWPVVATKNSLSTTEV